MEKREVRQLFTASFNAAILGTAAAAMIGSLLQFATGIGHPKIALAFVLGAMEAMAVISFVLGVDPANFAEHHAMRFLFIAVTVPFIAKCLAQGRAQK